ncbi:hypothetical protein PRO82_000215 [Candidatus Protochlamydia amoebophila]|nr:hypothetical protein [Candidatus Protochlamydia amoebophila]
MSNVLCNLMNLLKICNHLSETYTLFLQTLFSMKVA